MVYDAEMFMLMWASSKVAWFISSLCSPSPISTIYFYLNNTLVIKTIANPFIHLSQSTSLLFLYHVSLITSSFPQVQVTVDWSLGYTGVLGNN